MYPLETLLILLTTMVYVLLVNATDNKHLVVKLVEPRGTIIGHKLKSYKGHDYYAFQEIPYALPPVGPLRYKVPQKHPGWTGVLNTTENTRVCVQIVPTKLPQSEDCLYLNVYTPVKPSSFKKLAVFVWIHGGGYMFWDGTINRYSPTYLMDYNIIVVTIEYRLGPLGFLSTSDGVIPGNLGLRDQNLALRWVKKNIHLFGGDPQKITIGGESVGASSTGLHILSKLSRGLFRAAILQSGSAINTFNYIPNPNVYAFQLGKALDSSLVQQNTSRLFEVLQSADVNDIIEASKKVIPVAPGVGIGKEIIWGPIIETEFIEKPFIDKPMHEAFLEGDFAKVPQLIGFTSQEILWFMSLPPTVPGPVSGEEEILQRAIYFDEDYKRLVDNKLNINEYDKATVGKMYKELYTNSTFINDFDAFAEFSSDSYITHGVIRQADVSSNFVNVYLFQFDYYPSSILGAPHTEELQYFWKGEEDLGFVNSFQPILRDRLCKMWTNFIKYLNPTPKLDKNSGYILWPKVKPNIVKYLNLNKTFEVRTNPRHYYEIRKIRETYLKKPYIVY